MDWGFVMIYDLFIRLELKNRERELRPGLQEILHDWAVLHRSVKSVTIPGGEIAYVARNAGANSYHVSGSVHILIYGYVFTNRAYEDLSGAKPHLVDAVELAGFFRRFGSMLPEYLKGSFVVVAIDVRTREVTAIVDRLNVLPLFYAYTGGCLVISTSVRAILASEVAKPRIDKVSVLEALLFNYPLLDRSLFEGIKRLDAGTVYRFGEEGISTRKYWSVRQLYHEDLLGGREALETVASSYEEAVNLYAADADRFWLALTGGFDGRTNLSVLHREPTEFQAYSYGLPGSKQISIPLEISKRLGITYRPIFLEEEFEESYGEFADEAIELSNGLAPLSRANFNYVHRKLEPYADVVVSGLFGSEVLRPPYNLGTLLNDFIVSLFQSKTPQKTIKHFATVLVEKGYIQSRLVRHALDGVMEDIEKHYLQGYKDLARPIRLSMFFLDEGARKYFSWEISIERPYVTNRFPYLDFDFLDTLHKTRYAGMYGGYPGRGLLKRRESQLVYAFIIDKYKPELGVIPVDRGYAPRDLLHFFPLGFLRVVFGYTAARVYRLRVGDDTFKTEKWVIGTINRYLTENRETIDFWGSRIENIFRDGSFKKDFLKYCQVVSLMHYFDTLV